MTSFIFDRQGSYRKMGLPHMFNGQWDILEEEIDKVSVSRITDHVG